MMPEEPDYILDVSGLGADERESAGSTQTGRKWIGVHFECCGVYSRLYRHRDGTSYQGHCPRCTRRIRVPIGPGGTHSRIFRAS